VLRVSAPMAAVAAGLLIGSRGRAYDMSDLTRTHLDIFWGTLDELLNAALFVMMGLELMVLDVSPWLIIAGLGTWLAVLFARMVSVGIALIPFRARLEPGTWRWLTWGGLRGGISLALALSLPSSDASKTLIALTFVVVIISSLGQGLTLERVCRRKDQRNPSDGVDHQLGPMPIQSGPERLDGM
jgi:CPA1 family monovalent cation:H+ antiporter